MSDSGQPPPAAEPGGSKWAKDGCVTLRCREDGPLVVELPAAADGTSPCFRVIDHEGGEFALPAGKRAVALCRCGQSASRPFCDGTHRAAGFRSDELAAGP